MVLATYLLVEEVRLAETKGVEEVRLVEPELVVLAVEAEMGVTSGVGRGAAIAEAVSPCWTP